MMPSFLDTLHPASWRGVPFAVKSADETVGRRKVRHDYPYRDSAWLEDQGLLPPEFRIIGFLVEDSAVYGGGSLLSQRQAIRAAARATGQGILVHPMYGRLTVDLMNLIISERETGRVLELQFNFVQGGTQIFPAITGALGDLVGEAAGLADSAGLSAFSASVLVPLQSGISAATSIETTAGEWIERVQALARDATSLYGTVSQLGGADYGRYFNGRNSGFLAGLSSPYAGAASVADLIKLGAANRAAITDAAGSIHAALSEIGITKTSQDVGSAITATVAALQASAADPADGVRLLGSLASFTPLSPASRTVAGLATSDLFQRAAAAAVARASAAYAPFSADDAHAVRASALAPIEAVIARAGQTAEDGVFEAYRKLRKAVVDDLGARGGSLSRLIAVDLPSSMPDVVVAQRLYADASRAAELVTEANPKHPLFMPRTFKALAN